jgi:hypothetical protein
MEILRRLWSSAPYWAPLIVIAVAVWAVLHSRRSRSASVREQSRVEASTLEAESEMLDSSHIGFAPLVGVLEPPYDRGSLIAGDAKQK